MICDPCRAGGALNRLSILYPNERDALLKEARECHDDCVGRTVRTKCDCQHFTGEWLQAEFRPEAAREVELRDDGGTTSAQEL